jgi:hypothetical protein
MELSMLPVLLIGFNRPELLEMRVKELLQNKVTILSISIDGNELIRNEMELSLSKIEKMCENKCRLTTKLHSKNLGLAKHITSEITRMLGIYPEIIVLEDDIEIGNNFLTNMNNGLRTLREKNNIGIVSGFSPITEKVKLPMSNQWRTSPYFNCWGWVCTREVWQYYVLDLSDHNINQGLEKSRTWNRLNKWQQYLWLSRFIKIQRTPYHTWDIQFQYMCFKYEMLNISPLFSITNNAGFEDFRSIHTKGKKPKWMSNSSVNSDIVVSHASKITSLFYSKIIEPLTTAGDSRIIRLRNKIKN